MRVLLPAAREPLLGRRGAVRVLEALDVPAEHGPHAEPPDEAVEVHLHARLVAVRVREDDARPRRVLRIGPTVPSSSAFIRTCACRPGSRRDRVCALLDRPGDLDHRIDDSAAHDRRIVRDRRAATATASASSSAVPTSTTSVAPACAYARCAFQSAVRDRDEPHPGTAVDLERDPPAHESGADHPDPDRPEPPAPASRALSTICISLRIGAARSPGRSPASSVLLGQSRSRPATRSRTPGRPSGRPARPPACSAP